MCVGLQADALKMGFSPVCVYYSLAFGIFLLDGSVYCSAYCSAYCSDVWVRKSNTPRRTGDVRGVYYHVYINSVRLCILSKYATHSSKYSGNPCDMSVISYMRR